MCWLFNLLYHGVLQAARSPNTSAVKVRYKVQVVAAAWLPADFSGEEEVVPPFWVPDGREVL
jgi:hypothetical protein